MLKFNIRDYSKFYDDFSCINAFFPTARTKSVKTLTFAQAVSQLGISGQNTNYPSLPHGIPLVRISETSFKQYAFRTHEDVQEFFHVNDYYFQIHKEFGMFESKIFRSR